MLKLPNKEMIALHKHWLVADSIKERMLLPVAAAKEEKMKNELEAAAQMLSGFMALCVFYSLLYVVVEGYGELKGKDEKIDKLLATEEYVDKLRRFRNGTFHFQEDPLPAKVFDFLLSKDSESWIKDLHSAFNDWFVTELNLKGILVELQQNDLGALVERMKKEQVIRK